MSLFDLLAAAAEDPGKLIEAWEAGHTIGEILNDHIVQPYLDEHHVGSGPAGEEYLHWINEHNFDPIHPLESLHGHEPEHPDTTHHDHDPGANHDSNDSSDHHSIDFHEDLYT